MSSLRVENAGGGSATFQAQTSTESGGNWFSVVPASGSVAAQAVNITVSLILSNLSPGTYRGTITIAFTPGGTREVEVVAVYTSPEPHYEPPAYNDYELMRGEPRAAQCGGSTMQLVVNSVGTGTVVPVSFPRPLTVSVVDTCGEGIDVATVAAIVEGRTIALSPLGGGIYGGTWVPEQAAESVPISFAAVHVFYPRVDRTVTVSTEAAAGGVSLPVLFSDGVVEGAAFTSRRPLAPGGIVSLFGLSFAAEDAGSTALPLKRTLEGVSVRIGGEDAPLYFAGPGQINAQVPYSVEPGNEVPVVVRVNGQLTAPQTYLVAPVQPGIFLAGDGAAILDADSHLVNADNPAVRRSIAGLCDGPWRDGPPRPDRRRRSGI